MSKERYECGQRLRHLREKNNYTQESLSEILESINIKISERDIRNYESGKNMSAKNLLLLSNFFGVSPYYLFFGGDEMINTYTLKIKEELCSLKSFEQIKEIHDSKLEDATLAHLIITDDLIKEVRNVWVSKFFNRKGRSERKNIYLSYVGETVIKYCSNRSDFKEKFEI